MVFLQGHSACVKQINIVMSATILTSKEIYSENPTLHTLNVDNPLQFKKGHFIGKYSPSCVSIKITLKLFG